MNALQNWIVAWSPEAKAFLWLMFKVTVALAGAWLLHASLANVNPRWRRLDWRATMAGCALIVVWVDVASAGRLARFASSTRRRCQRPPCRPTR